MPFLRKEKAGHSPGLENLIVFQQVPDDPNVFVNVAAGVEIQVGTHIPGKLEQAGVISQTAGVGGKIAVPTQVVQRSAGELPVEGLGKDAGKVGSENLLGPAVGVDVYIFPGAFMLDDKFFQTQSLQGLQGSGAVVIAV